MLFPSIQNELQNLKEHYQMIFCENVCGSPISYFAWHKVVQYCDDMVTTYFKIYSVSLTTIYRMGLLVIIVIFPENCYKFFSAHLQRKI